MTKKTKPRKRKQDVRQFGFDDHGKHAKAIHEFLRRRMPDMNFTRALNLVHKKVAEWIESGELKFQDFLEDDSDD